MTTGTPFAHPEFDAHEQIVFCHEPETNLFAIIAIHSTKLGPAAGGCRMREYVNWDAALTDVLRLSRSMTYKNALAGLPLGGGKCVLIADSAGPNKHELLRAMGRQVQRLGGRYWTAIDVGVSPADVDVIAETCDYVFTRASQEPEGFNAAEFTALGVFTGVQAVAAEVFDRRGEPPTDLAGLSVAVQGLGGVGYDLCRQLHEVGADLIVADVDQARVARAVKAYGATAVAADRIHAAAADIFAPCALGAGLNDTTIPQLNARAVCGAANNQLERPAHAQALLDRGITYVPDYVVNAGGMIGGGTAIFTAPDADASRARIRELFATIRDILRRSAGDGRTTLAVADEMARERIAAGPAN